MDKEDDGKSKKSPLARPEESSRCVPPGEGWKVGVTENKKVDKRDFRESPGGLESQWKRHVGSLTRWRAEPIIAGGAEGASHEAGSHPQRCPHRHREVPGIADPLFRHPAGRQSGRRNREARRGAAGASGRNHHGERVVGGAGAEPGAAGGARRRPAAAGGGHDGEQGLRVGAEGGGSGRPGPPPPPTPRGGGGGGWSR